MTAAAPPIKPKPKRQPHVILGPNGRFQCMHCGTSYNPYPENGEGVPIWAMVALSKGFEAEHRGCRKPSRPLCTFCLKPSHPWDQHVNETTHNPDDWLTCLDTGTSSKLLWYHMMRQTPHHKLVALDNYPHDPDDFGRCYRLLHAGWARARGWSDRIGEMAVYGPVWAALAGAWAELEKLYEAKDETMYKRMTALEQAAPE